MDGGWLAPDVLHDIYFAASGPAHGAKIVPQHPEGRPYSLSVGELDSRLDSAVFESLKALRFEAGGGVITVAVSFLPRLDHQVAVLDAGILGAIRVILVFVVPPTASAKIEGPFGAINRGSAELITPDEVGVEGGGLNGGPWGGCKIKRREYHGEVYQEKYSRSLHIMCFLIGGDLFVDGGKFLSMRCRSGSCARS